MHVTKTTDLPTADSGKEDANPTIEAESNQDTTNSSTRGNNSSTTANEPPAANETESVTEGYKKQHDITNMEQLLSVAGSQVKLVQMLACSGPLSLNQKRILLHMGVMDVLVEVINRRDLDFDIYLQSIAIFDRLLEVGNFDHVKRLVRKGALARIHEIMETFHADDSRFLTISIWLYITMLKLIPTEENTGVGEPVTGNNRDQVTQQVVAVLDGLCGPNVLQVFCMRLMHIASLLFEENKELYMQLLLENGAIDIFITLIQVPRQPVLYACELVYEIITILFKSSTSVNDQQHMVAFVDNGGLCQSVEVIQQALPSSKKSLVMVCLDIHEHLLTHLPHEKKKYIAEEVFSITTEVTCMALDGKDFEMYSKTSSIIRAIMSLDTDLALCVCCLERVVQCIFDEWMIYGIQKWINIDVATLQALVGPDGAANTMENAGTRGGAA